MNAIFIILGCIVSLAIGFAVGYFVKKNSTKQVVETVDDTNVELELVEEDIDYEVIPQYRVGDRVMYQFYGDRNVYNDSIINVTIDNRGIFYTLEQSGDIVYDMDEINVSFNSSDISDYGIILD